MASRLTGGVIFGSFHNIATGESYGFADAADKSNLTSVARVTPVYPDAGISPPVITDVLAASADASILVGQFVNDAFLYDQSHGYRALDQILMELNLLPPGWHLVAAAGVSADGRTVVGYGIDPSGQTQAFAATVPEPMIALLLISGLPLFLRRRAQIITEP